MSSRLFLLFLAVVVYFAYQSWFSSDDEAPSTGTEHSTASPGDVPIESIEVEGEETAEPDGAPAEPRKLALNMAEGIEAERASVRDPAAALVQERTAARQRGDEDQVRRLNERIRREFPDSDAARWLQFEQGREALRRYRGLGKTTEGLQAAQEARLLLTPALFIRRVSGRERGELRKSLKELAQAVLFSSRHLEGADFRYVPKRGDTLERLCRGTFRSRGAHVAPGLVASVNRMRSPRDLRAGESIKVPLGKTHIVVQKHEFRLYLLVGGAYVADFTVGLGRDDLTPEHEFVVDNKMRNPDWFPRPGEKIPFGDPRNILGTRWLGFKNGSDYRGFGIHGTKDPASTGRNSSSGCVRMRQADVELVFDWTPHGTRVSIRR